MAEDWNAIAAEVTEALKDVGSTCVIVRSSEDYSTPWSASGKMFSTFELNVLETLQRIRDETGTQIGVTQTVLMVSAMSVVPETDDRIALNTTVAAMNDTTKFRVIDTVASISPAGVSVLYEITLKDI